jgi:pimeloyl-ACP methyl ester carboxylesterase
VAAAGLRSVPVTGGDLAVARWPGEGDVVLAIHGITGNHLWWAETVDALAGRATVFAPDLRGRSLSADLPGPYGLGAHVADLVDVLDGLGVQQATVVGHSMGGFVAARLVAAHPERVGRLVLCDGGVPLTTPAGSTPEDDLPGRIPLSWGRLGRDFADRRDYAAYWRSDPAVEQSWSDPVEAALLADLRERSDGRWRPALSREAVVADGVGLYDPAGAELLGGAATYLVPEAGGLHDPATVRAAVGDAVDVVVVPAVEHDTLLLSARGARAVTRQVLTGRCREHFR